MHLCATPDLTKLTALEIATFAFDFIADLHIPLCWVIRCDRIRSHLLVVHLLVVSIARIYQFSFGVPSRLIGMALPGLVVHCRGHLPLT